MSLSSWCAKAAPGTASARTMHGSNASTRGATPPTLATAYVAALAFIGSAHEAHEHVERAAVLVARHVLRVGAEPDEVAAVRDTAAEVGRRGAIVACQPGQEKISRLVTT